MSEFDIEKAIQNPQNSPYLDWIKEGIKTYEGRLSSKIQEWGLRDGLIIKFYNQSDKNSWVIVEVVSYEIFESFDEAYVILGSNLIPYLKREEVVDLYNGLFHYENEVLVSGKTSKKIIDEKVVAIGFRVISMNP